MHSCKGSKGQVSNKEANSAPAFSNKVTTTPKRIIIMWVFSLSLLKYLKNMQVIKQVGLLVDEFLSKYQFVFFGRVIVHNTACSKCKKNANRQLTIVKHMEHY